MSLSFELDRFIRNTAHGTMDDDDWREYARLIIDLAKAEIREEIREEIRKEIGAALLAKPATPPSEPVAPQRRWEVKLEILHPDTLETILDSFVIGSHATEEDAYKASRILNSILGSVYMFTINEV